MYGATSVHALVVVFFRLAPFDFALFTSVALQIASLTYSHWVKHSRPMVPTEKRSIDPVVSDTKPLRIEVGAALSPRVGEGQRICIEALCRSPLSPRGCATNISRRKESTSSTYLANQAHSLLGADDEMSENASRPSLTTTVADAKCSPTVRFFSVHLVVAAVADGSILSDQGTRKTKCVLDQLTRNVSKEQNQVGMHAV